MSGGFTKLFNSIIFSTIWREEAHVKITWVTMLALADADGMVAASLPGLADAARVSIEQCQQAIERLSSPDPYSRTKDFEGRRIHGVDGGWVILNYGKYRELGGGQAALDTPGYVYYIQTKDHSRIKIGFSKNPWARLSDLRVAVPSAVMLATESGTLETEHIRHAQFAESRVEGEWFTPSNDLLDHIKSLGPTTVVAKRPRRNKLWATKEAEAEAEADADKEKPSAVRQVTWVVLLASKWANTYGGTAPIGRIGKACKPLIENHGEAQVLTHWDNYLRATEARYASPEAFANRFGSWGATNGKPVDAPVNQEEACVIIRQAGLEPPAKMPHQFSSRAAVDKLVQMLRDAPSKAS